MSAALIIAGRFPTKGEADAVAAGIAQYVESADICIFHNNPPGQHDAYAVGGDEDADPGAEEAGTSAAGGALAAGLTAGAIGAPGEWRNGDWTDFNPVEKPQLVASASG